MSLHHRLIASPSGALSAGSKGLALAVLATAQLVIALDYSIVNVALPDIGRSLGFSGGTVQWVISAYALTFGGLLLLGGRAADLLGRRRMFMAALGLFGVASLAGGLTRHGGLLIACRLVQGVGGALLFPATLALVNTIFDEGRERTRAIAVWGSAGASGLSLGVLAGGVLTGLFGWPAVFYVNFPIVAALLAVAPLVLPDDRPASAARRFDLPGALLVTLAAMTIVDTLVQAPTVGWVSTRTLLGAVAGLVLLGLFVVVERRAESPLLSPRLLRTRTLRGGVLVTAAFMSSFGMQLFFLTLYLQQVLGEDPLQAGLRVLPLVLSVVVGTQLGGRLVGRLGIARTLAAGMAFGAVGLALYVRLPVTGSLADLLPGTIVAGLGQGVAFTTMYVAAGTGVALGGSGAGPTAQPPAVLTGALHATFAAQAAIALLGAAVALLVIGRGALYDRAGRDDRGQDLSAGHGSAVIRTTLNDHVGSAT
jgi:MFS family permease